MFYSRSSDVFRLAIKMCKTFSFKKETVLGNNCLVFSSKVWYIPFSRSSVGGSSSWWCAPFGAGAGTGAGGVQEPDYIPQRLQPQAQPWAPHQPKV